MSPADPRQLDRDHLATLTVLYVEDDEATRKHMRQVLRWRVGTLLVASSGAEGLAVCEAARPDLVLTDIQMPGMDGLSMAAELLRRGLSAPVLVTTAFEQPDYLHRCISLGVQEYILKPVDPERLDVALLDCAHRLRADASLASRARLAADLQRSQALSLLAAGLAHDYNNLLQVLLLNLSEALRRARPGTAEAELLVEARRSADQATRLGALVRQVAGGDLLRLERLAPGPLAAGELQRVLAGTGVTYQPGDTAAACPGLRVLGDARHLQALVAQLATNAVEAMPGGGAVSSRLTVASAADLEALPLPPGAYLHLEVADSGPGIDSKDLPRIFDAYFSTRVRGPDKGVGLGLTICRSIADRHRGLLTAESRPGEGARFHLYLPVAAEEAQAAP